MMTALECNMLHAPGECSLAPAESRFDVEQVKRRTIRRTQGRYSGDPRATCQNPGYMHMYICFCFLCVSVYFRKRSRCGVVAVIWTVWWWQRSGLDPSLHFCRGIWNGSFCLLGLGKLVCEDRQLDSQEHWHCLTGRKPTQPGAVGLWKSGWSQEPLGCWILNRIGDQLLQWDLGEEMRRECYSSSWHTWYLALEAGIIFRVIQSLKTV